MCDGAHGMLTDCSSQKLIGPPRRHFALYRYLGQQTQVIGYSISWIASPVGTLALPAHRHTQYHGGRFRCREVALFDRSTSSRIRTYRTHFIPLSLNVAYLPTRGERHPRRSVRATALTPPVQYSIRASHGRKYRRLFRRYLRAGASRRGPAACALANVVMPPTCTVLDAPDLPS